MTHVRKYWLCQIAGWTLYWIFNVIFGLLFYPIHWAPMVSYGVGSVAAIGFTHGLRAVMIRGSWLELSQWRLWPRVLLVCVVGGYVVGFCVWVVFALTGTVEKGSTGRNILIAAGMIWAIMMLLWNLLYIGIHYVERLRRTEVDKVRLEMAAKEAQLRALLAQLNPHFLFNSLNSLRGLIAEDPLRAQSMVTELAGLLRYSLASGLSETVSLATELDAVRSYLALESIRLEERLTVRIHVDPDVLDAALPPMLLQTLVENAVKHGIAQLPRGGEILVEARRSGDDVRIEVSNTGRLRSAPGGTQIGLRNARERLRMLFGSAASLILAEAGADLVRATVALPFRRTEA